MLIWVVPVPLGLIVAVLLVLFVVAQHFWLFLFTVGPVAVGGMLFVRWCWDRQDRRRRDRDLARVERSRNRKEET
jgi:hypothetical protein